MTNRRILQGALLALALVAATAGAQGQTDAEAKATLRRRMTQANFHLVEFEKEVARARGGQKAVWHYRQTALDRVQELKQDFPDDPEVERMFQRTRTALMKSMGKYSEVKGGWTAYKTREADLRKQVWAAGEAYWKEALAAAGTDYLERLFPAPDPMQVRAEQVNGKLVVLEGVKYPERQFYGASGEYVACGKPSEGYYYLALNGRDWLGPYEAVKRYRRTVDSGLLDVAEWTVLGRIGGVVAEMPVAGKKAVGNFQFGWVVHPIALMVPGHVVAFHDADAPSSGRFVAEDKVDAIKDGWYTVKSVPDNVTPKQLMEIFMAAIREKNYPLYCACIAPELQETDAGKDLLRYHWDLHQERFHGEYVHATFGPPRISVVKGFDDANEQYDFFLKDDQKETVRKGNGRKVEEALVESRAIDENGKQVGAPHPHTLRRTAGGRWYVHSYELRF